MTDTPKKAVEIIENADGSYSVLVYGTIIFTGTRANCDLRADGQDN